ncbi:hypothetical protein HN011_009903, partial [Eciton burchellii]
MENSPETEKTEQRSRSIGSRWRSSSIENGCNEQSYEGAGRPSKRTGNAEYAWPIHIDIDVDKSCP